MGLFDNAFTPLADKVKEGDVFTIEDAKVGPSIPTEFGQGSPALFKIEGKWYSIFGQGLLNQVEQMDDSDRANMPMRVKIIRERTKGGRDLKRMVPANYSGSDDDIPF